jgi:hypothetical protein
MHFDLTDDSIDPRDNECGFDKPSLINKLEPPAGIEPATY